MQAGTYAILTYPLSVGCKPTEMHSWKIDCCTACIGRTQHNPVQSLLTVAVASCCTVLHYSRLLNVYRSSRQACTGLWARKAWAPLPASSPPASTKPRQCAHATDSMTSTKAGPIGTGLWVWKLNCQGVMANQCMRHGACSSVKKSVALVALVKSQRASVAIAR